MATFRQRITGSAIIFVEAEDMFEADKIIREMGRDDLDSKLTDIDWYNWDTDEFPEEW